MANTIFKAKRTSVSGRLPNTTSTSNSSYIYPGELAFNLADRKLYSAYAGVPFEVGANLSSLNVTGNAFITGTLTVTGNTIYTGNITYINTTQLNVGDNIISLNADVTGAPSESAGISVNRGTSSNVSFLWDESSNTWSTNTENLYVGGTINAISISTPAFTASNLTSVNITATNNFTVANGSISLNTDISGWHFSGRSLSVTAKETSPQDLFFSPDGLNLYVIGNTSDAVHQYVLSSAFDISTGTFSGTFSISGQETGPLGIFFKPDGSKMYIIGSTSDAIHQYSLATPWSITTASYDSLSASVLSQDTTSHGLFFKSDGTAVFTVGSTTDTTYRYNLSTPWDISTASFSTSFNHGASIEGSITGVTFNTAGTIMYLVGTDFSYILKYTLSTPWDITTATYGGRKSVYNADPTPTGIFYRESENKIWISGSTNDSVYEYVTNDSSSLKVTANAVFFDGIITVSNNAVFDGNAQIRGNSKVEGSSAVDGALTVTGSSSLSTTTVTGTFTVTGTTTATSIQSTQTTGAITVGGTTGTGAITLGQSTGVQTVGIATGATTSSNTKTVNIGTGGISGSITNVNIGSAVSGALGTTTINSNNVILPNNLAVTGTANVATALNVGANVNVTPSQINIGNATVNSVLTSTALTTGITTVNSTVITVGANVIANSTAIFVGNSTVNSILTSSLLTTATANLSTEVNVGANVNLSTTQIRVGNSTVNTVITSTTISGNAAATLGNTTINGTLSTTGNTVAAQVNATSINVGANVNLSATQLNIGNSTVNTVITSTTMSGNGAGILNVDAATVGGNTASTLRTYSESQASNAYTTATADSANASNITSGTLATARLPATANVSTSINVGANVNLSTAQINVGNSTVNTVITSSTISSANLTLSGAAVINVSSSTNALRISQLGAGNVLLIEDDTSPDSSPMVIDASGYMVRGHTSRASHWVANNATPDTYVVGSSTPGIGIIGHASTPSMMIGRTANSTLGGRALVSSGDELGVLAFVGDTNSGSSMAVGSRIAAAVDGTANDTSLPTRLELRVTPTGALLPTTRVFVYSNNTIATSSSSELQIGPTTGTTGGVVLANTQLKIGNTTSNAVLTQTYLSIGTTTSNTQLYANSIVVGNSSVGTVNAVAINVGANVNLITTGVNVGNSTVNTFITSSSIRTGTLTTSGNTVAAQINATSINVGANVNLTNSRINVGNSTVNTFITSSSISTNGTLNVTGNTVAAQVNATSIFANNLTLTGNLTVSGTTTYINTTTLNVGDNIITLNADVTGAPTENAGIEINRGTSTNTSFYWDEASDKWTVGNDAYVSGTLEVTNNATVSLLLTTNTLSVSNTASIVGDTTIGGTANVGTTLNVGSNVNISTSQINVGNSTVNTVITSSSISGNGASITSINASSISTGTLDTARLPATANVSTAVNVGSNVNISTSQISVGNATVNTVITSTSITGNGANITSVNAATVGGNTASTLRTYSESQASNAYTTAIANSANATNITSGTLATARLPATVNVATVINVGANVNLGVSDLRIGNATVNTVITSTNLTTPYANITSSGFEFIQAGGTETFKISRSSFGSGQDVSILSNSVGSHVTFNSTVSNPKQGFIDVVQANTSAEASLSLRVNGVSKLKANSTLVYITSDITTNGTYSVVAGNSTVNAIALIGLDANTFGRIELGGTSGGYIDFKSPAADDFDHRLNSNSSGFYINARSSTSSNNVIVFADSTLINTTSFAVANTTANNLTIVANGNVGIANSTPGSLLTVGGSVYSTTSVGVGSNVTLGVSDLRIGNATVNAVISSTALTLSTNTATFGNTMFIAANGNISMGTTASAWKLLVNGPAVANVANSQSLVARFQANSNNVDALEITNTRGTEGGAIPDWYTAGFRIQQKVDATWMGYIQFNGTTSGNNAGGISFGTGQSSSNAISIAERLRIAPSGNVGISTTAPDATLKVGGTANVTGNVVVGGTLSIAGNTTIDSTTLTTRDITSNGITITVAAGTTGLDLNGSNITDVNRISISDPGPYEGIVFDGGSGWAIFESPNDLTTNASGNLQFVVANTRVGTVTSTGYDTPFSFTSNTNVRVVDTNGNTTINSTSISTSSLGTNTFTYASVLLSGATLTTSATTANQVFDTFSSSTYRTAKYLVQVTSGTDYHSTEIMLIHNGTTVYKTEYGTNYTNSLLATFDADISTGNVRLLATPVNAVTTFKASRTSIPV